MCLTVVHPRRCLPLRLRLLFLSFYSSLSSPINSHFYTLIINSTFTRFHHQSNLKSISFYSRCEKIVGHGINCFINRQLIYNFPEQVCSLSPLCSMLSTLLYFSLPFLFVVLPTFYPFLSTSCPLFFLCTTSNPSVLPFVH